MLHRTQGWEPVDLTGYGDFNLLVLLIPVGLFLLGLASGFLPHKVPFKGVLSIMGVFFVATAASFYYYWVHEPQQKVEAVESRYLEWFETNYPQLHFSVEDKLEILHSPYGFLDTEGKKHYIMAPVGTGEEYFLQYIGEDNLHTYKPVASEKNTI